MADTSLTHVNYGHPGTASYHLENRNWAFARQYTTLQLKRIRNTTSIQSATTLATAPARFPLPRTSATRTVLRTHAKVLVKSNPHLSPALGLLPSLALLSAAVSSTAAAYDPLVGTLLSFGSITLANRYETPRRVAALATGEAGNILQLAILNTEVYDWGQGEKTWVEGPTLKDAQNGYWNEEAAPIQQICFAQSGDKSCLLAVRLPTRTVLLRPIYHRQARLVPSSPFYHLPTSVVEPHPVITVQQKDTGGSPHVDFAFNPDHQLQFAIVDQNRTWSVWDIHHRRKGDRYTSSLLARGRINEPEDNDTSSQDGWARILWVADLRTLLVCNRRHLGIVSIQDRSHVYHSCSNIIGHRSTDWILDVKKHPKDRSQFFVLTSSKLALMVVTMSSEAGAGADKAMVTMLASWKHYRSTEDFTLQMEVQLLSDEESFVIVYSAVNKLVQVHSFSQSLLSSSTPITCSDPSLVNLGLDQSATISKLHIQPMRGEGMRTDMCFFRLFVTQFNGDLQELVLYSASVGSTGSDQVVEDFERSTIKHPRAGLSKTALVDEEADFVVANRLAVAGSPSPRIAPQMPRFRPTSEDVPMRYLRDQRLMISSLMWPETASDTSDWADVVQTTNEVEQKLIGGLDYISRPLSTLMDHANLKLVVQDVDKASSKLEELFSLQNRHDSVEIRHIASGSQLDLTERDNTTISDVYDNILERWIAPLPPQVPVSVRRAKERLARRVAAELVFSCTRVREIGLDDKTTGPEDIPSQESGGILPILPTKEAILYPLSQLFASQPLPTPPPSSLPGSSPPIPSSASLVPSDPLSRLRMHLRCEESSQTPVSIANSISQLCAHWQTGTDPCVYDWVATERNLQPERREEREKRERREKRQQREDKRKQFVAMNQPTTLPRSCPGLMLGEMSSSSQMPTHSQSQPQLSTQSGGFMIPQSQVERGRFGGRPDKKKNKKGRISGF